MTDEKKPEPQEKPVRVFAQLSMGDVGVTLWQPQRGGSLLTTIEKKIHPKLREASPISAHTFSPQDISALRKLLQEAEDAHFSYQSTIYEAPHGKDDQTALSPIEEALNAKDKEVK